VHDEIELRIAVGRVGGGPEGHRLERLPGPNAVAAEALLEQGKDARKEGGTADHQHVVDGLR
jgi:hypothetical protein